MLAEDPISLIGKVAVVTGAAQGIGRSVAITLARRGADVVVTDLPGERASLQAVASEIERLGRRAHVFTADLANKAQVDELVSSAVQQLGGIDILVNNAGIHMYPSPLLTVSESDWDKVMAVNVKGPLFTCQAVLPHMIDRGSGSIVQHRFRQRVRRDRGRGALRHLQDRTRANVVVLGEGIGGQRRACQLARAGLGQDTPHGRILCGS